MNLNSRTVLIIDDSPEDCELYRRYLSHDRNYTYTILEAELGRQGLDLWRQYRPDAILLDYHLPDLDGLEVLKQLQQSSQQICLPVIVVTGQGNEAIAVETMKAGSQDYLVKGTITPEVLQVAVNSAIETTQLRNQLQQCMERERLVAQLTRKIHQSLELEEILRTTVDEVRQFLRTDRVLIFQLQSDGCGTIITESVGAEWTAFLSTSYCDPCFHEQYTEPFRQGLVTVKPDIYDGSINPCHVELLAKLQVRANLVVPILQDQHLWGMLIAHHCASPRQWQAFEVDLLKEVAAQVGIALKQAGLHQQLKTELEERKKMEERLQRKAQILNQIHDAVISTDLNGQITSWNQGAVRLLGYSAAEAIGQHISLLYPTPEMRDFLQHHIVTPLLAKGDHEVEVKMQRKSGERMDALLSLSLLRDVQHQPIGMIGYAMDITERRQAQAVLADNEARLRGFVDANVVGMLYGDIYGNILEANDALLEMIGYSREELHSGKIRWLDITPPEFLPLDEQAIAQAQATGACTPYEKEYIHKDGHRVPVLLGYSLVGEDREESVAFILDLTDRKRTEEALQQSEAFKDRMLASSPDCIKVLDLEGRLLYMNAGGLCVMEIDDFTPYCNAEWIGFWEGNEQQQAQQALATAKAGGTSTFQGYCPTAKGTPKWWEVIVSPILDGAGQVERVLSISRDITERKQAEQEREHLLAQEKAAREEAERANRVKDEFLAILSHELRSPLNPILGWTKLMQSRAFEPEETAAALATIERSVKVQIQLIDDLLDIAKILRGKLTMKTEPVNLVIAVESAIETVQSAAQAKSIQLHAVLPQLGLVIGDTTRLQQIVWNLLSNAIKFTPDQGRVEIHLGQVGNWAQIIVSDTGKGIKPDFLPHLFESFCQEDASTTRRFGGLGLGLAIVRSLVEAHGGTVWAESLGEGQGSTFTVQLPLLTTELESIPPDQSSLLNLNLTGMRVLTVDDDPDVREIITAILTQAGVEVLTVASAAEVLTALDSFQPDVLVSDIGMPELDGYTLIRHIQALFARRGKYLPAIALTAYARQEDVQRALREGFQQHLSKPIEPAQLIQAIARCIKQ
jgi:PAS domain S-box-containing protein